MSEALLLKQLHRQDVFRAVLEASPFSKRALAVSDAKKRSSEEEVDAAEEVAPRTVLDETATRDIRATEAIVAADPRTAERIAHMRLEHRHSANTRAHLRKMQLSALPMSAQKEVTAARHDTAALLRKDVDVGGALAKARAKASTRVPKSKAAKKAAAAAEAKAGKKKKSKKAGLTAEDKLLDSLF